MKCPYCKKEIKRDEIVGMFTFNLFIVLAGLASLFFILNLKINIEDGYSYNWDIILMLVLALVYMIYLILYRLKKVKGTFVLFKEEK